MQVYTVGFAVHQGHVFLILKNRGPASVRDRYNGIGGKVEVGEAPRAAQRREFREEAGLDIEEFRWRHTVVLKHLHQAWAVWFFVVHLTDEEVRAVRAMEDEPIGSFDLLELPSNVVPNLRWLLPLSLDPDIVFPLQIEDHKG